MIDKCKCDDGFVWNPSICERDKSFYVAEFLDYENCKCRKKFIDKLVLEFKYEVLNAIPIYTADTISIADKKVTCKKNCLISINLMKIISSLLQAIASIFLSVVITTIQDIG